MLHWLDSTQDLPPGCQHGVVSIGNFDGVHLGHLRLVERLRTAAANQNTKAIALTFDPHPVTLLRPEQSLMPLTWTERKAQLLAEHGVDEVLVMRTSRALLTLDAADFFETVVRHTLRAHGLVEGPNFGFGRNRSGTIATLRTLSAAAGIQLEVVQPVEIDGGVVSSSRVRERLSAGDAAAASRLLGRPHRIRGRVGRGAARGSTLGFPTANLERCDVLVPADGVYAGACDRTSVRWPVALNIGPNPTFQEHERKIEAHLVGFRGDLTGTSLEIDLITRLRDTCRFAGASELVTQLEKDVESARAALAALPSTTIGPGDG